MTDQAKLNGFRRRLKPDPSPDTRCAMVGIRMTPDREREVKVEAAQRGLSVADLFDEIWLAYVRGKQGQ